MINIVWQHTILGTELFIGNLVMSWNGWTHDSGFDNKASNVDLDYKFLELVTVVERWED